MKPFLLFCLLLAVPLHAAPAAEDPFTQANRAFAEDKAPEAAAGYQALLKAGWSAPLLFNLGNAEQKSGHIGRALLAYDRAALLAPRDPDLEANRALTLRQANLPAPGTPWEQAAARLSPNEWAWLLVAALAAACGGGLGLYLRPRAPLRLFTAAAALAVLVAASGIVLWRPALRRAFVVVPEAPYRILPFLQPKAVFTLADGSAVAVVGTHGDFLRVRDAKGAVGWLLRGDAETVLP